MYDCFRVCRVQRSRFRAQELELGVADKPRTVSIQERPPKKPGRGAAPKVLGTANTPVPPPPTPLSLNPKPPHP